MGTSASSTARPSSSTTATSASPATTDKTAHVYEADAPSMDRLATRASRTRVTLVELHNICGHTQHGVPAYSNGTSNTWTGAKSYRDGVFMGYQWQCVEFARRWLWTTQRLLLPERDCAFFFSRCAYVYRMKDDPVDPRRAAGQAANPIDAGASTITKEITTTTTTTAANAAVLTTTTEAVREVAGPKKDPTAWEKVPVVFVKQGSSVPPVADSLIVYPMSWGSPWGHIGVITAVDLERGLVYVGDQNRYFHQWGERGHSAVFPLEVSKGKYYIRDHESECSGWMTFPSAVKGH